MGSLFLLLRGKANNLLIHQCNLFFWVGGGGFPLNIIVGIINTVMSSGNNIHACKVQLQTNKHRHFSFFGTLFDLGLSPDCNLLFSPHTVFVNLLTWLFLSPCQKKSMRVSIQGFPRAFPFLSISLPCLLYLKPYTLFASSDFSKSYSWYQNPTSVIS